MIIALNASNQLNIFIAREGDTIENQLAWLFDIDLGRDMFSRFRIGEFSESDEDSFFTDLILERIGIETITYEPTLLETLIERFGSRFRPQQYSLSSLERYVNLLMQVRPRILLFPDGSILRKSVQGV